MPFGTCQVTPGDAGRVVRGTVLTPDGPIHNGQVVVDAQGTIISAGCASDCVSPECAAQSARATVITCPDGVISPGLINTHDHLTFSQNTPQVPANGERYEQRGDWRHGSCGHTKLVVPGSATTNQMAWAELRFLLGGATATVGAGGAAGLLANLDGSPRADVSGIPRAEVATFPLNDTQYAACTAPLTCDAYSGTVTEAQLDAVNAYLPHVAEGVGQVATHEAGCLGPANPGHNIRQPKTAFVQGVGLDTTELADMATHGVGLVWSPRSSIQLYGDTARVNVAARLGVELALGTDWVATGSMNLLRELKCADAFNASYLDHAFSDRDLWMMVTANAADLAGYSAAIGSLVPGRRADISIFNGAVHKDYRAVVDAAPEDVLLVLLAGQAVYGDADVVSSLHPLGTCDALDVCFRAKQVCLQDQIGMPLAQLEDGVGSVYPLFFCGEPASEPTCTPSRPMSVQGSTIYSGAPSALDVDGDGVANAQDNCPSVFNPVRPGEALGQPDFDQDSLGDACDPCPLAPNTTACPAPAVADVDGDTFPDFLDNCPTTSNTDQADADSDGKGDVCDACAVFNPGQLVCPVSIYALKDGSIALGTTVSLLNVLVTAKDASGYCVQAKPGDQDYAGVNGSGICVVEAGSVVQRGDRVFLPSAVLRDYFGEIELASTTPTTVMASMDEAPPAPLPVTPAQVATDGPRSLELQGVLVSVAGVVVTDNMPPLGPGDAPPSNEFVVDGTLRVDDTYFLATPFPQAGQRYDFIAGVVRLLHGDSKLEPRDASEVVATPHFLGGFAPAQTFVRAGSMGVASIPAPLRVVLDAPRVVDTFITVTPSDILSLEVVGGGVTVPAGALGADVVLNGLNPSESVVLTAVDGVVALQATVVVLDPARVPVLLPFNPATVSLAAGASVPFTVLTDIPAPAGGVGVSLSLNPANGGSIPATVTILPDQMSAEFTYVDGVTAQSLVLTATLGPSTAALTLSVAPAGCVTDRILISEVRSRGAGGASDEFVELYNPTAQSVTLDATWKLEARSNTATAYSVRWTGAGQVLLPGQHFLVGGLGYVQQPSPDGSLGSGLPDAVSLRLVEAGMVVDAVCFGPDAASNAPFTADATYTCEGTPATNSHANTAATNADLGIERRPGGAAGNCVDTGDNSADFFMSAPANPQSQASPSVP